jgi:anti-anti-sigma factor
VDDPTAHTRLAGPADTVLVVQAPEAIGHEAAHPLLEEIRRRLPDCDKPGLVLDMRDVRVISSIGVTMLLQAQEHVRDRGGDMILARLPDAQRDFLRMLGLTRRFPDEPGLEAAIDRLADAG